MTIPQARQLGRPLMNLVKFKGTPILQQLRLEERLLRNSSDNWCIINDGTNIPAIVMGLSGKPSELLEIRSVLRDQIPVVRRFTGGGTVIVDHGTIFVTLICNREAVPTVQPYPRSIMQWSSLLYNEVFQGIGDFKLRENDYVFGNHKFGGNAQSITKDRWIHHTSFLWEYEARNMAYLKLPTRAPEYRLVRNHMDFLCGMKDYLPRSAFISKTVEAIENHFLTKPVIMDIDAVTSGTDYVHTTKLLSEQELEEAYARELSGEIPVSNLMI
ncbi:hypothetical protein RJ640_025672 [Escallonia rubra]|uniref:BPL/LPL catalytic domain-containing protein n=1 Tax=Escallonia rubra TaxID=112253 RepID=A0AA88UUW3_9ASTE|nr:hypothetical protein RJ640_025672 [Escallonia rubra]